MTERRNYERYLIRKFALLKLESEEITEEHTRDMSENETIFTEFYGSISRIGNQDVSCIFLKINSIYYQLICSQYA